MTTSTDTTLQTALAAAQAEFPPIPKTKTAKIKTKAGGEYSYHYADLADILKVILPIMGKHGLAVVQPLQRDATGRLCVTTKVMHGDSAIDSGGLIVPEGLEPQELGSILTYWRRYDLCSLLAIAPDEDTDANVATGKSKQPSARSKETADPAVNPPNSKKVTKEVALARISDVSKAEGAKTKRAYLWVTFAVAGSKQERGICEDPKLFEAVLAAQNRDTELELRRDPNMNFPRIIGINARPERSAS